MEECVQGNIKRGVQGDIKRGVQGDIKRGVQEKNASNFETHIINRIYSIERIIGQGSFGVVYKGHNIKTLDPVAIKTEHVDNQMKILKHEAYILNHLYRNGCKCVSPIYYYGLCSRHLCLVMNYFNQSLEDYMKTHLIYDISAVQENRKLLHKVMTKMIDIIENIHSRDIVHRDLKPQNFMIDSHNHIYLIDFGMATTFLSADTGKHIDENVVSSCGRELLLGNPTYMSYNLYQGYEPVRRDDLISIGYMYLYFINGKLPWSYIPTPSPENTKDTYPILHVKHWKNQYYKQQKCWDSLYNVLIIYDDPIIDYMRYCYRLAFDFTPNYEGLKHLFLST
jgi:casein kinase 1